MPSPQRGPQRASGDAKASPSRRERNKQEKLDRIIAAATELFARHGVGEVTTQQIADLADIGTGTLFLYAKTKGELLLMVQNSRYAHALTEGTTAAVRVDDPAAAAMAILRPIIECNRSHVENGRTYLRELAFGDPNEPQRAAALGIVLETTQALENSLQRTGHLSTAEARELAEFIQARVFLAMATSGPQVPTSTLLTGITRGVETLLRDAGSVDL